MTHEEKLAVVIREMLQIGYAWRMNWNDFDGRTLRDQLEGIASWAAKGDGDYHEGSDFHVRQTVGCYENLPDAVKCVTEEGGKPSPGLIEEAQKEKSVKQ